VKKLDLGDVEKGFRTGQICAEDLSPGAALLTVLQILGELRLLHTESTDVTVVGKCKDLICGFLISLKKSFPFILPLT
jgi:hypothetical protein